MGNCQLESPDRRVISHFFGRNKKETRAIPDDCWVTYCRQHYQRCRYRQPTAQFAALQMDLVRQTVNKLELWGGVREWQILLRKRASDALAAEEQVVATHGQVLHSCRERVLLPQVGKQKTFEDVYHLLDFVEENAAKYDCDALEFEIVPQFRPGVLQAKEPAAKRGKTSSSHRRSVSRTSEV